MQSPLRWSADADWKLDYCNIDRMTPEEIAKRRTEFDRVIARYNASQTEYRVVSYFQGPYDDVMADEIKLRRGTRRSPHIVQVQDAATAEMMRSGHARAFWQLVQESRPKPRTHSRRKPQPASSGRSYLHRCSRRKVPSRRSNTTRQSNREPRTG